MLAAALAAGCGAESRGLALTEDIELSARIAEVQRTGGTARLRDLTGGEWDRVRVFQEPVSREYVEHDLDERLDMPEFFATRGHILVFFEDDEIQRVVYTTPNNLTPGSYGPEATLKAPETNAERLLVSDRP